VACGTPSRYQVGGAEYMLVTQRARDIPDHAMMLQQAFLHPAPHLLFG